MRKWMVGLVALAMLGGTAACGDDDGGSDGLAGDLQTAAEEDGEELTDDQAQCLADVMVAILGQEDAEAAASEGSAGIETAMTEFATALTTGGDTEAAQQVVDNLESVDQECLDDIGIDPASVPGLSEGSGDMGDEEMAPESSEEE